MNFIEYWELEEPPFEENVNPKFFYESIDHLEALERLRYVLESTNMNMGLLTGEIGSGKTMTRNVLIEELYESEDNLIVKLDSSGYRYLDILKEILHQLTSTLPQDLPRSKYLLESGLKQLLENEVVPMGKKVIIFMDESQKMEKKCLDSLKDLTNIAFNYVAPIKIILIGQPDLLSKIKALPQVDQRIGMRYHLNHMTQEDTVSYIEHRLYRAGNEDQILTDKAYELIYSKTDGIPREINRACKIALDLAYAQEKDFVDESIMQIIFNDFYRYERLSNIEIRKDAPARKWALNYSRDC